MTKLRALWPLLFLTLALAPAKAHAYPQPSEYQEMQDVAYDVWRDADTVVYYAKLNYDTSDLWQGNAIDDWEHFLSSARFFRLSSLTPEKKDLVESDFAWLAHDYDWADQSSWHLPDDFHYHPELKRIEQGMARLEEMFK